MDWQTTLIEELATPGKLVGHFSYILLIASMMMRTMTWLRILAIASALVSVVYGLFVLRDYVIAFWEITFIVVNLVQLFLLELENRRAKFSIDEDRFIRSVMPNVPRGQARRLLAIAERVDFEAGSVLTEENMPIEQLLFIVEGAVRIDRGGAMVGVCGHDDFIGEMGFMLNQPASATAVVTHSARCLRFDYKPLRAILDKDATLRHAVEGSFNRNVMGKLVKTNESITPAKPSPSPLLSEPDLV